MKIMLFDVPAEFGGALTILNQYYDAACDDAANEWIFVVSKPELSERENIKVLRFPWVKKSWAHRLYFDKIYAKKLIKKYAPDKVISLQNTTVSAKGCFQELYVHQSLPFCEKRFSFSESKKFWVYQNVIAKMIIKSIRKADAVIVQTKWMKEAVLAKSWIDESRIKIVPPVVHLPENVKYIKGDEVIFFYPADAMLYKNHAAIYKAVQLLQEKGYDNFRVVLTIENKAAQNEENSSLIAFCGYMDKEKMNEHYQKSILLFPSYLETFGLPLLEARTCGCPIIASDCSFSREILEGYEKANFFNPFEPEELAELMMEYIEGNRD